MWYDLCGFGFETWCTLDFFHSYQHIEQFLHMEKNTFNEQFACLTKFSTEMGIKHTIKKDMMKLVKFQS